MVLRKQFARNIKIQRELRCLTQESAAELCDLSSRYWGKIERGQTSTSIDVIEKISSGLNIDASELLKSSPEENNEVQSQ